MLPSMELVFFSEFWGPNHSNDEKCVQVFPVTVVSLLFFFFFLGGGKVLFLSQ